MEAAQSEFREVGQRVLDWVSPDEAARRVRELELKSLLVQFVAHGRKKRDLSFERFAERSDTVELEQAAVRRDDAEHDDRDQIGQARKQL